MSSSGDSSGGESSDTLDDAFDPELSAQIERVRLRLLDDDRLEALLEEVQAEIGRRQVEASAHQTWGHVSSVAIGSTVVQPVEWRRLGISSVAW